MTGVELDARSPIPLHEQVAAQLRRAIADGECRGGDRLPPAKDLAAVMGTNVNTVLRALRNLRDEQLLEFRRGRGITVTGVAPARSELVAQARALLAVAQRHGLTHAEVVTLLDELATVHPGETRTSRH